MRHVKLVIPALLILGLTTGFTGFWHDLREIVDQTVVTVRADGSDTRLISPVHRPEAAALVAFATTYNRIAYAADRSQDARCAELEPLALAAIGEREKSFQGLHEVACTPNPMSGVPQLIMRIWPQTRHDYRFVITFAPDAQHP